MKALGFEVTKQQVIEMMKQFDPSSSGHIVYQDFVSLSRLYGIGINAGSVTDKILSRDPMEEISLAFKLFDDDNTGECGRRFETSTQGQYL